MPEVRTAARKYTTEAVATLAGIMRNGQSEQARIAAANSLLDRGYGKPAQTLAGDPDMPLNVVTRIELVPVQPRSVNDAGPRK
jgi:hypothetical protein